MRFTPRKPGSVGSESNVARVERMIAEGRMTPAGRRSSTRPNAAARGTSGSGSRRTPPDLETALAAEPTAAARWRAWARPTAASTSTGCSTRSAGDAGAARRREVRRAAAGLKPGRAGLTHGDPSWRRQVLRWRTRKARGPNVRVGCAPEERRTMESSEGRPGPSARGALRRSGRARPRGRATRCGGIRAGRARVGAPFGLRSLARPPLSRRRLPGVRQHRRRRGRRPGHDRGAHVGRRSGGRGHRHHGVRRPHRDHHERSAVPVSRA